MLSCFIHCLVQYGKTKHWTLRLLYRNHEQITNSKHDVSIFWWSRQSNAPISGPRLFLDRLLGPSEGKTRVLKKTLGITLRWDTNCQESQNSADSSCWFRWCLMTECMVRNMIVTFSEDSWNTAELSSSVVSISSTLSGELPLHWLNHPHPVTFQHLQDVSPWFLSRSPWQPSPHPTFLKIICLAQLAKITIANLVFLCFSARFEWFEIDGNINQPLKLAGPNFKQRY